MSIPWNSTCPHLCCTALVTTLGLGTRLSNTAQQHSLQICQHFRMQVVHLCSFMALLLSGSVLLSSCYVSTDGTTYLLIRAPNPPNQTLLVHSHSRSICSLVCFAPHIGHTVSTTMPRLLRLCIIAIALEKPPHERSDFWGSFLSRFLAITSLY